jgi:glutamyl-tRNA synthetase
VYLPYAEGGERLLARLDSGMTAKLLKALPALKQRARTLADLMTGSQFLFSERPLVLDDKARQQLGPEARQMLAELLPEIEGAPEWTAPALEQAVKRHAEARQMKLGAVAQPLRAALTGTVVSPGIFEVLEALGRAESLARIREQLA